MGLMFEVAEGGFLDIDVRIVGPDGKTIHQVGWTRQWCDSHSLHLITPREKGSQTGSTRLLLTWTVSTSTASPTKCPPWRPRLSCLAWTLEKPPVTQPRMKKVVRRWGLSWNLLKRRKYRSISGLAQQAGGHDQGTEHCPHWSQTRARVHAGNQETLRRFGCSIFYALFRLETAFTAPLMRIPTHV